MSWDDRRHVCFHDIRSQRDRPCPLIGRHNTLRRLYRRLLCRNYENVSVLPSYYFRTLQSANSNTTTTARRDGKRRCVRVVPAKLLTPFLFRGKIFYRLFYDDGRRPVSPSMFSATNPEDLTCARSSGTEKVSIEFVLSGPKKVEK